MPVCRRCPRSHCPLSVPGEGRRIFTQSPSPSPRTCSGSTVPRAQWLLAFAGRWMPEQLRLDEKAEHRCSSKTATATNRQRRGARLIQPGGNPGHRCPTSRALRHGALSHRRFLRDGTAARRRDAHLLSPALTCSHLLRDLLAHLFPTCYVGCANTAAERAALCKQTQFLTGHWPRGLCEKTYQARAGGTGAPERDPLPSSGSVIGGEAQHEMLRIDRLVELGAVELHAALGCQRRRLGADRPAVDDAVLRILQLGADVGHALAIVGRVDHLAAVRDLLAAVCERTALDRVVDQRERRPLLRQRQADQRSDPARAERYDRAGTGDHCHAGAII